MSSFTRPLPTKLAAALVATGIATTGAVIDVSDVRAPSPITAEVANTSFVTDLLYDAGSVISALGAGVDTAATAAVSLPFDVAAALAVASQSPSLAPAVFSWIIQLYANPAQAYPYVTYPWQIEQYTITPILYALLPPATAADLIARIETLTNSIGNALVTAFPNSATGRAAYNAFFATELGRALRAVNLGILSPLAVLDTVVDYAAFLPANLEATAESAIRNPSQIPGLVSYLAYGLLASYGLAGNLVGDIAQPFVALPNPIGQQAAALRNSIWVSLNNFLSNLPAPIAPTPFPATLATVDAAVTSAAPEVESFAARTTGEESPESTDGEGSSVSTDSAAEEEDSSAAEEDLLSSNDLQAGDEKSAVEDEAGEEDDATDPSSESGDATDKDDEAAGDPAGESADEAGAEKSADAAA